MRRRGRKWVHGEVFGTSLADILTTALGCVLLLFLVAVMNIRQALSTEKASHELTTEQLVAEEHGRKVAEQERQVVQGAKSAVEQALARAQAARGESERALRAAEEEKRGLDAKLLAAGEALAAAQKTEQELKERHGRLREAAARVVERLDPGQMAPVDLMLVIDGTRSMVPSLDAARRDLQSLARALGVVSSSARVGVVVFRDSREAEGVRTEAHPLTNDFAALETFLGGIQAMSTRVDTDLPEWLEGGIREAARSGWREEAVRLMVVVSDAANQDGAGPAVQAAREFRDAGGRVFVLSTLPAGYETKPDVATDYRDAVLPEHAAVAAAGGGIHIEGTGGDQLVHEALKAALHTRDAEPLDALKGALDGEAPPE